MTNSPEIKAKAIALRKQGLSYSEIRTQIPVAKSTLSDWLHSVGLAKYQKQRLTEKKRLGQIKAAETRRKIRLESSMILREKSLAEAKLLSSDTLWIMGASVYWAEGSKQKPWNVSSRVTFSNMDPEMHRIFLKWLLKYCDTKMTDLAFSIYIHEQADSELAKKFWAKKMKIQKKDIAVYFKRHNLKPHRHNRGENYHGLLRVAVKQSTNLNRRIAGWIEGMLKYVY